MPSNAAAELTGAVATVLTDALGRAARVAVGGVESPETTTLLGVLTGLGWTAAAGSDQRDALVVPEASAPDGGWPSVVVVLHAKATSERPWPGWDERVVAAGYHGCARAGRWTWYVADDRAADLGPRLGGLPDATPKLLDELIEWRTAALTRWASRADDESGRPNRELKAELRHANELLAALQASFSWRVTSPLRAVRSWRRPRAARR